MADDESTSKPDETRARAAETDVAEPADEVPEPDQAEPAGDIPDATGDDPADPTGRAGVSPVRAAIVAGLVVVIALGAVAGFLGFRARQATQLADQQKVFLETGKQGALNLTVFDFANVDAQIQRTLDLATGKFYDDFQRRAPSFTELVKQVKSTSTGTVTDAGVESQTSSGARVLVAVIVTSQIEGQPAQPPNLWRMRLAVDEVDGAAKVSDVEFVQ